MKKYIFALCAAVLLGAGCSQQTDMQVTTEPEFVVTTERVDETTPIVDVEGEVIGQADIEVDVTTTVNCGDADCFEPKFAACEPATIVSDAGFASFSYEIIGPVSGGCSMRVLYPKNPNPAWVNQPMVCTFDNSIAFEASTQQTLAAAMGESSTCTGPLADLIKS